MDTKRSFRAVGSFTVAYLLLAVAAAFVRGNREFLFYIAVMVILIGAVLAVHRRVNLTHGALWALSVWGLLHMLGGLMPVPEAWPINGEIRVLYSLWFIPGYLKYDHVVHAYGFGTTTWVCWQGLRAAFRGVGKEVQPTFGLMVLAAAGGMGFGALNEVIEFVAVLLVPNTNVGGYMNTGWDLVANLTGAFVAVKLIYFFDRGPVEEDTAGVL
jgi:uncharacterized membrane protein YjdF